MTTLSIFAVFHISTAWISSRRRFTGIKNGESLQVTTVLDVCFAAKELDLELCSTFYADFFKWELYENLYRFLCTATIT